VEAGLAALTLSGGGSQRVPLPTTIASLQLPAPSRAVGECPPADAVGSDLFLLPPVFAGAKCWV